jgi:galactokinase
MEIVSAPGRLNIIGDHTDYADGFSLACAIDQHLQLTFTRQTDVVELQSNYSEQSAAFTLHKCEDCASIEPQWLRRVAAVGAVLQRQGYQLQGFSGSITSTIPVGAGLSSSAALAMAAGSALCPEVTLSDLVLAAQQSEFLAAGVRCGCLINSPLPTDAKITRSSLISVPARPPPFPFLTILSFGSSIHNWNVL